MTLKDLAVGQKGRITKVNTTGFLKQRFVSMGLTKGVEVEVIKVAPLGDPIEIEVRGYNLSVRKDDAQDIEIEVL